MKLSEWLRFLITTFIWLSLKKNILEISRVVFAFNKISPECGRSRQICNYHWKAQALRKILQYY